MLFRPIVAKSFISDIGVPESESAACLSCLAQLPASQASDPPVPTPIEPPEQRGPRQPRLVTIQMRLDLLQEVRHLRLGIRNIERFSDLDELMFALGQQRANVRGAEKRTASGS